MRPPRRPARRPATLATLATLLAAVLLTGCAGGSTTAGPSATAYTDLPATELTVLAASSLTTPLTALAAEYENDHPGLTVHLSFGSSTTLAQQVAAGAPADLAVFAGTKALAALPPTVTATHPPVTIARNRLEIAVPQGNPARVTGIGDLARPSVKVVLCVATAPCGAAADEALAKAEVTAHVVSREVDVKATVTKVRLGEADAGIVYHSDVVSSAGALDGIEIPDATNITLAYPLVRVSETPGAAELADFLTGPRARTVLTEAGFLPR